MRKVGCLFMWEYFEARSQNRETSTVSFVIFVRPHRRSRLSLEGFSEFDT